MSLTRLRVASLFLLVVLEPARALETGAFLEVESEADLGDLVASGALTAAEADELRALLAAGVDLARADREELLALPNLGPAEVDAILRARAAGMVQDPGDLVVNGALSPQELRSLGAFLRAKRTDAARAGWLLRSAFTPGDALLPPASLTAKAESGPWSAGVGAMLTRLTPSEVVWDPNRRALSARAPEARSALFGLFAAYGGDRLVAVLGTFRIGFAERLTFDTTGLRAPAGVRLDLEVSQGTGLSRACRLVLAEAAPDCDLLKRTAPDPDVREPLQGAAIELSGLSLGASTLSAQAFISLASRGIRETEIVDRRRSEATAASDPDSAVPSVFARGDDPLAPSPRLRATVLPEMFRELVAGGHLSLRLDERTRIGLTGYGTWIDWLVEGAALDFAEGARRPPGGPFGAIGLDFGAGLGRLSLAAEVVRSFDSTEAFGGFAGIIRAAYVLEDLELEVQGRLYDPDFENPFARPVAASDAAGGLAARDEAFGRVGASARLGPLSFHGFLDLWSPLTVPTPKLQTGLQAVLALGLFEPGLSVRFSDRDLGLACPAEEPTYCATRALHLGAGLTLRPAGFTVEGRIRHSLVEDERAAFVGEPRQDLALALSGRGEVFPQLRLEGGGRFSVEALGTPRLERRRIWLFAGGRYAGERLRCGLRYDLDLPEDGPAVHWFRLELGLSGPLSL